MADSDRSRIIPDGWIFKPKVRRGSNASHYFCPATGQIFSTYKALMHYVEYAKKAKVSIYAPDFYADKSSGKRKGRSQTKTKIYKPATGGKVYTRRTRAASAALKQLPSDVGQITVPKSGTSGHFPPKSWEEACLPDSKEVSPAVGRTKVTRRRTEAGSAALKQLPSDVGQKKVLKFGIGGEFPPKVGKEACLADPEEGFPAVDQTKVPRKRTEAGSAALKQLPSAVGQIKVPKFGISDNIPRKRRKQAFLLDAKKLPPAINETKVPKVAMIAVPPERKKKACLPDLKQLSPGDDHSKDLNSASGVEFPPKRPREGHLQLSPAINETKVPMGAMRAELPPEKKKEACLPDLKQLSPGDDHFKDLKSASGVEYPPKRLREGYLQLSPAVDQTSIWSTSTREKIPPRRKNYCPPAIKQPSLGESSKLGAINESEVNIGSMDMTPMGNYGGIQEYTPLEGGSSETNYDWAFEANLFPFQAGFEAGEEPTISALDRSYQYFMEPSRPYIEHQYQRRNGRNKSTRPTVGQLRKKAT